jgi:hypothetical protein
MKENTKIVKDMVKENSLGLMDKNTMESLGMGKNGMEHHTIKTKTLPKNM